LKKAKLKIVLIGSGNLAFHLGKSFAALPGYPLVQIYARSAAQARQLGSKFNCKFTHVLEDIEKNAGLYLLCVSDDQIAAVAQSLSAFINPDAVVAHTSGSTPTHVLGKWYSNFGVMYPLQTFSRSKKMVPVTVPWFITGSDKKSSDLLKHTAGLLSSKLSVVDDETRLRLHLAAVLVNNFPNFIFDLVYEFLSVNNLDFKLLLPLLEETMAKLKTLTPEMAQTGPAKRHDKKVIDLHLNLLQKERQDELFEVYRLFSSLIWKRNEDK
jgi:predicted short-subunit dehydrogenase-like oxidoreductase (DUF2520 family)